MGDIQRKTLGMLATILSMFVVINVSMIFNQYKPMIPDAFFMNRLADLNFVIPTINNTGHIDSNVLMNLGFDQMPFMPFLLIIISKIIGQGLLESITIPVVNLVGFVSMFVLVNKLIQRQILSLGLAIYVLMYAFWPWGSLVYSEYYLAYALYPLAIFILIQMSSTHLIKFSLIFLILYTAINFYGQPFATWVLLVTLLVGIYRYTNNHSPKLLGISIILFVIYLSGHSKFYDYLSLSKNFDHILDTIAMSTGLSSKSSEFIYVPHSVSILEKSVNTTLFFLPIFTMMLWVFIVGLDLLQKSPKYIQKEKAIYGLILLAPFILEIITYGSLGYIPWRYYRLMYLPISIYLLNTTTKKVADKALAQKFTKGIVAVAIILSILSSSFLIEGDNIYVRSPESSTHAFTSWFSRSANIIEINVITDYKTSGIIEYYSPYPIAIKLFHESTYQELVFGNIQNDQDFYFISLNTIKNNPIIEGPPKWNRYTPLSKYYCKIFANNKVNLVYTSKSISAILYYSQ